MTTPHVTWYRDPDGIYKAFVHAGDVVRTITAHSLTHAEKMLTSVGISEFAMTPDDAGAMAAASVKEHVDAQTLPETLSDHVVLLQEQLADHESKVSAITATLTSETQRRIKAESDLALAKHDLGVLQAELDKINATASAAAEPSTTNTSAANGAESLTAASATGRTEPSGDNLSADQTHTPPATGGVVLTPAGETPSAEASTLHTETGAAPITAATGGEGGKT